MKITNCTILLFGLLITAVPFNPSKSINPAIIENRQLDELEGFEEQEASNDLAEIPELSVIGNQNQINEIGDNVDEFDIENEDVLNSEGVSAPELVATEGIQDGEEDANSTLVNFVSSGRPNDSAEPLTSSVSQDPSATDSSSAIASDSLGANQSTHASGIDGNGLQSNNSSEPNINGDATSSNKSDSNTLPSGTIEPTSSQGNQLSDGLSSSATNISFSDRNGVPGSSDLSINPAFAASAASQNEQGPQTSSSEATAKEIGSQQFSDQEEDSNEDDQNVESLFDADDVSTATESNIL